MTARQRFMLNVFRRAKLLTVEPGFVVESRTIHGIYGEPDALAVRITWRDCLGCEWAADFSEASLAVAERQRGRIKLLDMLGETIWLKVFACRQAR